MKRSWGITIIVVYLFLLALVFLMIMPDWAAATVSRQDMTMVSLNSEEIIDRDGHGDLLKKREKAYRQVSKK